MEESHEAQGQIKMKNATSNRNTDRKTDSNKKKKNLEQQQATGRWRPINQKEARSIEADL